MSNPKLQLESTASDLKTPTEKVVTAESALQEMVVTASDGKVYKLRLPDPLDEADLFAALGREHSANMGVLVMAMPLIYIESVNGVPYQKPNSYPEIRMAIKKLGREGYNVIQPAIAKFQELNAMKLEDINNLKN